jgi:hypothetical protein
MLPTVVAGAAEAAVTAGFIADYAEDAETSGVRKEL